MAKKKTSAELRAENRMLRAHGIGNNITKIFRDLIKYGSFVAIAYCTYLSIDSLAGKTTEADINVKAEGSVSVTPGQTNQGKNASKSEIISNTTVIKIAVILSLLLGVGGIVYGRKQAKLRKDVIERYHPAIQEAEQTTDPNRSTSKLTYRGDTRPEDI